MRFNGCLMQALATLVIVGITIGGLGFAIVDRSISPAPPVVVTVDVAPLQTPTPIPSRTPLPTFTPLPTSTATPTVTPSPTSTPTNTVTPSRTPTFTPSSTPTQTFTPTPATLCAVRSNRIDLINLRAAPDRFSELVVQLPNNTHMDVYDFAFENDVILWYLVEVELDGTLYEGWVLSDLTEDVTECPIIN